MKFIHLLLLNTKLDSSKWGIYWIVSKTKKIPCNVGASRKAKLSSNCTAIVASHLKINYSYIIVLLFKSCMECNTLVTLYMLCYIDCYSVTPLPVWQQFTPYVCGLIEMIQRRTPRIHARTLLMSSKCPRKSEPICRQPKNQSAEVPIVYGESSYGGQHDCKAKTSGKH